MSYTFSFIPPSVGTTETVDATFLEVDMPGCIGLGRQPGDPTLPVKFIQLLLPPQKIVDSVMVTGSPVELKLSGIDLTRERVYPYQDEVPIGSLAPSKFVMNEEVYSSRDFYPALPYREYHIGYSHGYTILDMALQPMQLIPTEGRLFYYPEMTVTVSLRKNGYLNPFFRGTPEDEAWVKDLVYNPLVVARYIGLPTFEYPGGLCDPSDQYDYVIITTTQNSLNDWNVSGNTPYNWESLMEKHVGDGLTCTLVTIQDIDTCSDYYNSTPLFNDSQAHIREFCRDAYEDWGTRYVLIGADAEYITARLMDYGFETDVDSDLYWSNLDNTFNADHDDYWGEEGDTGFDLYSELFLGRIPCDMPQDVSNWLNKGFRYTDANETDYLENGGFYANGGGPQGFVEADDFIDFAAIKGTDNWLGPDPDYEGPWPEWLGFLWRLETWNAMHSHHGFNLSVQWTTCIPNPGWRQGDAVVEFQHAINNDTVTLITGIGQGSAEMSLDVFDSEWEISYHNTMPFFISDLGCHCGDIDAVDDGVLGSMLFHSDTELAFGCLYNSGYSFMNSGYSTNSSVNLQTKLFWDYLFDVTNNSGSYLNWQFGKGLAWSKDIMAPTLNWDSTWRGILQDRLLFADPAQRLRFPNNPPQKPTMLWSPDVGLRIAATDPEVDDVYYKIDWDDGTATEWLGPFHSDEEEILTHHWTMPGVYEVKAKAKDIYDAVSDWSDPLLVEITGPAFTVESIHGGFGISMILNNTGSVDVSNVVWNIELNGGLILLGKSKSGVISILPVGEFRAANSFIFGFGKTMITVNATCAEGATARKTESGWVFGIFVFGLK